MPVLPAKMLFTLKLSALVNKYENRQNLSPEIKVSLPKPKPYLWSLAAFYFLVFIAVIAGLGAGFAWFLRILKLSFTHLGNFNFADFFSNYPFVEKIAIGVGGLLAITIFLFLSLSLVFIYDKEWRKFFFKLLAFLGVLHLLGWLLYYFGVLG